MGDNWNGDIFLVSVDTGAGQAVQGEVQRAAGPQFAGAPDPRDRAAAAVPAAWRLIGCAWPSRNLSGNPCVGLSKGRKIQPYTVLVEQFPSAGQMMAAWCEMHK